jgi:hypothetical protein
VRSSVQLNASQAVAFATLLYAKQVVVFRTGTLNRARGRLYFEYTGRN